MWRPTDTQAPPQTASSSIIWERCSFFLESIFIDQATLNGTRPNSPAGVKPARPLRERCSASVDPRLRLSVDRCAQGGARHCRAPPASGVVCDVAIGTAQQRGYFKRLCLKPPVANAQDRAVRSALVKPRRKCESHSVHVAVDAEGARTSPAESRTRTVSRVGRASGLDRGQLDPAKTAH